MDYTMSSQEEEAPKEQTFTAEQGDDNDGSNERTTAISYYLLYQEINKSLPETAQEDAVWHEDEWTEQDTLEAERVLQEAEERCNVQHQASQRKHTITRTHPSSNDWNSFYQQHETHFFKDRHYLKRAFPEEMSSGDAPKTLVEIGCGVGNTLLPLLKDDGWIVWGLDFSNVAIELLKNEERFRNSKGRAHARVWDISQPPPLDDEKQLPPPLPWFGVANVTTLLFCLSALNPKDMAVAARNVASTLKSEGTLLFRDFGRYDEAQLKLGTSRGKRLGENWYRKHDGTRVYYFALEDLERLFVHEAGLKMLELQYIRRVYYNRGTRERRRRVWVQGRFRKALEMNG